LFFIKTQTGFFLRNILLLFEAFSLFPSLVVCGVFRKELEKPGREITATYMFFAIEVG
jgi:hypothetical protein